MSSKPRKQVLFFVLGIAVFLLVFLLAGCAGKSTQKTPIKSATEIDFREPLSDRLWDDKSPTDEIEPDGLEAIDILTLPAGTVISNERVDDAQLSEYFVSVMISDDVYNRIIGKSYIENPYVSLDDLRYLKLLHYNFDHQIQVGELIVSAELDVEFLEIFLELFVQEYEIQSMYLVDNYWTGDAITTDDASIAANNTSAFSYRIVPMSGNLSRHAYGKAIDINPRQNPYVEYYNGVPYWEDENADLYIDRSSGLDHMITHDDECFRAFDQRGYIWGGDWWFPLDYQHFEK